MRNSGFMDGVVTISRSIRLVTGKVRDVSLLPSCDNMVLSPLAPISLLSLINDISCLRRITTTSRPRRIRNAPATTFD